MKTTKQSLTWWEVSDVKVGQILPLDSPYARARVVRISANGWCQCKWPDGVKFSARVHWLTPKDVIYSSL